MLEASQKPHPGACDFADIPGLEREVMIIARKLDVADALLIALKEYLEVRQELDQSRFVDA